MIHHDLHWQYVCECGFSRSTTDEAEADQVRLRHEGECPMIEDAWRVLDGYVQEIAADPQNESMKERARGGAAVLASVLAVSPATVSRDCSRRAALAAAGQPVTTLSSAELRGLYEPLGGAA